jgi:hypothetical protein
MLGKDNTEEVEGEEVVNAKLDLRAVSRHNGHWPYVNQYPNGIFVATVALTKQ